MDLERIERARPVAEQPLVHDGIDRAFIGRLVREFYARVRRNERLGPIFARHITGNWEPHLEKMTDFWCSVILKTGTYQGRPVPAHMKLTEVVESDFAIWLGLFAETARDLCPPEVAEIFIDRSQRIARSLSLVLFFHLPSRGAAPVANENGN
ncbi:MAG: group III truncated hemoglobin [Pseudaminobacter sp.]